MIFEDYMVAKVIYDRQEWLLVKNGDYWFPAGWETFSITDDQLATGKWQFGKIDGEEQWWPKCTKNYDWSIVSRPFPFVV